MLQDARRLDLHDVCTSMVRRYQLRRGRAARALSATPEGAGIVGLGVNGGEVWHDGNGWCEVGVCIVVAAVEELSVMSYAGAMMRSRWRDPHVVLPTEGGGINGRSEVRSGRGA
jgi:hypothetical protein